MKERQSKLTRKRLYISISHEIQTIRSFEISKTNQTNILSKLG